MGLIFLLHLSISVLTAEQKAKGRWEQVSLFLLPYYAKPIFRTVVPSTCLRITLKNAINLQNISHGIENCVT